MKFVFLGATLASLGLGLVGVANAEEVPAGYVVNKANLGLVDKQTFDGHNLGELIPPTMRIAVENGLTLKLAPAKPLMLPAKKVAMTEKYSGGVKYDPATRRISGYVAGYPFPKLSENDPDVAGKIVWNNFYANGMITDVNQTHATGYLINVNKGIERSNSLTNSHIKLTHRDAVEPVAPKFLGDGKIFRKMLIFNMAPQDVAGTGAYFQRYDDGRLDDSWAYIKAIRRVRRLSGGTWMDPLAGLDMLNDDTNCLDGFPGWYKSFKLVKKQWALGIVHSRPSNGKVDELINTKTAPYGNPINQPWEPLEVFVVEAIPPAEHPYSKKLMYFSPKSNTMVWCAYYDKKGALWRTHINPVAVSKTASGDMTVVATFQWILDVQRQHSTYIDIDYYRQDDPKADPGDWSEAALSDPDKFSIEGLTKRMGPSSWTPWTAPWKE